MPRRWNVSRTTAQHTDDLLETIVFSDVQTQNPIRLTWRLDSVPSAEGAFTVGLAAAGGPYGTRLGTEVQFRGSRALWGPISDNLGNSVPPQEFICGPGSVFTLEWDAGIVTFTATTNVSTTPPTV